MLADDVLAALRWVQDREGGREAMMVGHSSGGGLAQIVLGDQSQKGVSEGEVRVKGLVLVGSVPGFGRWVLFLFLRPLFSFSPVSFWFV